MSKDIPWIKFDQEKAAAGQHVRLAHTSSRYFYVGTNASGDHVLHSLSETGNHGAAFCMAKDNECVMGLWPRMKKLWVVVAWEDDGTRSFYADTEAHARDTASRLGLSEILICQEVEVPV